MTPLLLLCVSVGAAAAADGPISRLDRQPLSVDEAALARAHLGVCWRLNLPLRPAEQVTMLSLVDDHVYAITDRGKLFAVRAESGLVHWQRSIVEAGGFVFPLTHALAGRELGPAVVTTPSWVALLDRESGREIPFVDPQTGKEIPRMPLLAPPSASIVANAEYLYASLATNRFVCYRRKDGYTEWAMGVNVSGSTTPRLLADSVLFASNSGRFFMFSTEPSQHGTIIWTDQLGTAPLEPIIGLTSAERKKIWPKEAVTTPLEPISLSPDGLFFTGTDQTVYSIDPVKGPVDGQCRWRYSLSARPTEGPAVVGDLVFQHDPSQGLFAIDRLSGRLRWLLARGRRLLARGGGEVVALGTDGRLLVADEITGSVRSRVPIAGIQFAPTDLVADAVYLASQQGQIVCIRNPEAKTLKREAFLPATGAAQTQAATASRPTAGEAVPATPAAKARPAGIEDDVLRSNRR